MKIRPIPWRIRLGLTLRQMAIDLYTTGKPLPMIKLSEKKIVEGKAILERLKTKLPSKPLDYEELTLAEPRTIWPLQRDPKTGRMIKPERRN